MYPFSRIRVEWNVVQFISDHGRWKKSNGFQDLFCKFLTILDFMHNCREFVDVAIYALCPESFCVKNLAVRKVFVFSDSGYLYLIFLDVQTEIAATELQNIWYFTYYIWELDIWYFLWKSLMLKWRQQHSSRITLTFKIFDI